jgi:hypothetical protein
VGIDAKLIEVARSAEAGGRLPTVRLATAAQLIVGIPGRSADFNEVTWQPIVSDLEREAGSAPALGWSQEKLAKKQAARDERFERGAQELRDGWGPAAHAPELDPPENLTLYNALVWRWGEHSGLRVPAVRVALSAVTAWWVGQGQIVKGGERGRMGCIRVRAHQPGQLTHVALSNVRLLAKR